MTRFSDRLKNLRKEKDLSQQELANIIKISKSSINMYERGEREPSFETMESFADFFNVDMDYLHGRQDIKRKVDITGEFQKQQNLPDNIRPAVKRRYKYLGKVACGEPIFAEEQRETYVDLESDVRADFVLEAKGDSMINARIYDGDIVFIREQPSVEDGEIAVVIIDDEATLKRFYKYDDHISLCAENPKYKPIVIKADEGKNIRIIGKAIGAYIHLN